MNIKIDMKPVVVAGIKVREENFGALIVSKRTPILTMNKDSFAIWKNINGKNSIADIIRILRANYADHDNDNRDIVALVLEFMEDCVKLGLLEIN